MISGAGVATLSGQITGNYNLTLGTTGAINTSLILANTHTTNAANGTVGGLVSTDNWTGDTNISFGTAGNRTNLITLGANEQIPSGIGFGNLVINDSGTGSTTLNLNGYNQSVNGLTSKFNTAANVGSTTAIVISNNVSGTSGHSGNAILTVGGNNQTATFSGVIGGEGAGTITLNKIGTGIQTLGNANTYTGNTNINNGAVSVTGSLSTSGTVNVNTSATSAGALYGTGTVGSVVTAAATGSNVAVINPGATGAGSYGTLTVSGASGLTVGTGSNLQFDLASGANVDKIQVNGNVSFGGASTITPSSTTAGDYVVVNATGTIAGSVAPSIVSAGDTRLTYSVGSGSWDPVSNAAGKQIIVHVAGFVAQHLTWTGLDGVNANAWDLHQSHNWNTTETPTVNLDPTLFYNGDNVFFDNTGINRDISLGSNIAPGNMTFNNDTGFDYSISGGGSILGGGVLTKNLGGTLTINNSNTFSGGVVLNAGTLNVNNNGALGTGSLTIAGGTLGNTSGGLVALSSNPTQTWTSDIAFNGPNDLNLGTGAVNSTTTGSTRTFNITAGTLTVGGSIKENTANVGITKTGGGTLALGGNSTFTGVTNVNAGTLSVGSSASLGGAVVINTTPSGNQITLTSVTGFSVGNGVAGTGIPVGTIITAIDSVNNILTLSATTTTATATDVTFATSTADINVADGAALDLGGGTTANAIVLGPRAVKITGTGVGGTGALTNSGTVAQQNALQNLTLTGNATVGGIGRIDVRGSTPVVPVLNLGGHTLTKTGTGQFSLVGATVTAGNIVVNQGRLSLETTTAMPNDGSTTTYNDGTIAGFFQTGADGAGNSFLQRPMTMNGNVSIDDESGAPSATYTGLSTVGGNITLNGNLTFTGGSAGASLKLTGTITEMNGPRSLTKTAGSTAILTATSNSYSGPTNLNGGLLQFAALGTLGTGTQLNFAGGGLQYAPSMASPPDLSVRTLTFNAGGGTIDTNGNSVSFANAIGNNGVGGFTKAGDGTLTLNAASTYTGNTTVARGTLVLAAAGAFPNNTGLTMGGLDTSNNNTSGTLDLVGHSITVTGLATATGADQNNNGSTIGSSSTTQNVTLTFASPNNTPNVYGGSIVDGVNGGSKTTALTVSSGTLVLNNGGNSYSGATTINPGATLQLGNNATANPSLNSASAITDNGSLVFGGNSLNLNNSITGSGSVTQASGTTTLSAANSYMGGTTLQGGVLQINSDAGINNGVGGIQFSSGVLQFGGYTSNLSFNSGNTTGNVSLASSGTSTLNGSINTTGNFTYSGFGTLTLAGTVNYTGATNITQSGTLILGAAASLPNNTSLTMGDAASNGSPTLDVNGHNITVSSLTSLGTGTPTIINNSTTTNATITLNGGATANAFAGQIQNGSNNKTLALTINSGSLTLTNSNNYSGNTTIGPGATLSLSNGTVNGSIPNTAHLTLNGGTFATGGQGLDMHTTKLLVGASSVIDLGAGSGTLQLADSTDQAWNASAYLRINNWSGNLTGAGTDQITFTGSGLLPAQLNKVHFTGYVTGSQLITGGELVPLTALKIGDVNQDGVVSVADISALMTALTDPATYLTNHPALVDSLTVTDLFDVNGDGKDTSTDIQALISKIATNGGNPSLSAVPEPTSLVLLAIGGVCGIAIRLRRKTPAI